MKKTLTVFGEILIDVGIIIGLVLIIRTFIVAPFQVHGSSMCPTFNYVNGICETDFGEYLIIAKFKYLFEEPKRGDIIVFRPPNESKDTKDTKEEFFIKRIIGLPGETLEISNGEVFVDGKKLKESYLKGKKTYLPDGIYKKYEIPEGKYFVMGDNRDHSIDSRWCFRDSSVNGCKGGKTPYLTKEMIQGKSWLILYPLNEIGIIASPKS